MSDAAGIEHLFHRHAAGLVLFARQWCRDRADAEDAVQDAFVQFCSTRNTVRDPAAYLYAAVRSRAMDRLRQEQRRTRRETHVASSQSQPLFELTLERNELAASVEAALGRLPVEQREVLVLKIWAELTFAQIAEVLRILQNTAAARYRYAIAALRKELSEQVSP